ncbi:hypothetical protein ACELLULO517_08590 [Acidisoma cellulosilytica]|uniref:Uncharacterized protein n=1 Tax=Acidisoma cellulosilyticum TaxID=2802395 RepID=A0A963Z1J4_9PROT|nr:hypothetical protein [Acidisoma cellulosilyticum]MCB8880287.1 hypothetical protein [Acidisoma cellulosilyticum]
MPRSAVAKSSAVSSANKASAKLAAASSAASKEELRARIEKLERANATLRFKNKDLRLAHVEASEQVDALTMKIESLERRAERQSRQDLPKTAKSRGPASPARGRGVSKAMAKSMDQDEDRMEDMAEA